MRILLLTQYFQPEPMFKGLPLAKALQARGHDVEVLTGFPNYPEGRLYAGYERQRFRHEILDGVPVHRVPLYPSHDRSGLRRATNFVSFGASSAIAAIVQSRQPDVVWVYNLVTLWPTWTILRLKHRCRVVLEVQDLWPESVLGSGMMHRSRFLRRALAAVCAAAYRSADGLIAQSPGFRERLIEAGVPAERVGVIYNWADETVPEPSPAERAAAREKARMDGRFTVLFAGTMGTTQALDCVMRAAALLQTRRPEIQFVLVGGGVDVDRLKMLAASLANVRFLPRCSPAEALALTVEADALLVHLRADPLSAMPIPSKTQAYLRAGRPILIGVKGDAAQLVEAAGAGLSFEPENGDSLAAAVEQLVDEGAEALRTRGRNGRAYYDEKLAFLNGVQQTELHLVYHSHQ